jgi:large subunit ribosomal protein L5
MATRLREHFDKKVRPALQEKFNYTNANKMPRLEKVVLNMGVGETTQSTKAIEGAVADMALIAGQKPVIRSAKKSIANFKVRKGMPLGCSVTLRKDRMYEFVDRLCSVALPRVRDFRGVPKKFDGNGNYSLGVPDQSIFPEIDIEKSEARGLSITFVTTAKTDEEAQFLLAQLGIPFRH